MDRPIFITVNDERVICNNIDDVVEVVRDVMGDEVADVIRNEFSSQEELIRDYQRLHFGYR